MQTLAESDLLACVECSLSIVGQSDLRRNDRKSVNRRLSDHSWPEYSFLVLTKINAGSGDETEGKSREMERAHNNTCHVSPRKMCSRWSVDSLLT